MAILSAARNAASAEESSAMVIAPLGLPQQMPKRPSPSVAELSERLYAAYQIEAGSVRLAGCTLEPIGVIHVRGASAGRDIDVFLSLAGEPLDDVTIADLGLNEIMPADKVVRLARAESERIATLGKQAIETDCRQANIKLDSDAEVDVIWCRWAAGKLRFAMGEQFVDLPFADWAVRLAPPPFVCPLTGRSTFKLAATDDGRLVAAEEIATCEQSHRRMLRSELVTCSVTGKQVDREFTEICPATDQPVLRERMTTCPTCLMRVSPHAVAHNHCVACTKLTSVRKADPRMCLVLGEQPGLDRWRHWRLAETPPAYVLEARSLWRRLLVVVDKKTLQPIRLAGRNRFQSAWSDIPPEGWREILQ